MRTSWLVGLLLLVVPTGAEAQLGKVVILGTEPVCDSLTFVGCTVGAMTCPSGQVCHELSTGSGACAAEDALFCDPEGGPVSSCPVGHHYETVLGLEVCVPDGISFCGDEVRYCFQSPVDSGGTLGLPVGYDYGDCDRDGLRNRDDPAPCVAPATIGLVDPTTGSCDPYVTRVCATDADCLPDRPICADVATDPSEEHRYCVATDPAALCCGGMAEAVCVNGASCEPEGLDGVDLCHPYCREDGWTFEMRLECLRDPDDSTKFVAAGAGDCDGDGVVNGEEARLDRDPCVPEDGGVPMPSDAGAAAEDAGAVDRDAAQAPMDAAAPSIPVQPRFEGGGGCRCRASAGGSSGSVAWLGLVALALWRRRRHRARRQSA